MISVGQMLRCASLVGLRVFLVVTAVIALGRGKKLFLEPHGWTHRLVGGFSYVWLLVGAVLVPGMSLDNDVGNYQRILWLLYDFFMGILGIAATLTAAKEFPHKHVKNEAGQSGTLEEKAIVTQSEMIEHGFYQFLNLWQALYLHGMAYMASRYDWNRQGTKFFRLLALLLVTSPWWVRRRFPVHSFSDNWTRRKRSSPSTDEKENTATETFLYMIKKWQYVFYKHFILHGLNLSIAISRTPTLIPHSTAWRIFWIALNTSYLMEFFLQTMVKRKVLTQSAMLTLQRLLMAASTLAAVDAVWIDCDNGTHNASSSILENDSPHSALETQVMLRMKTSLLSLSLNFCNRHHDVANTLMIAIAAFFIHEYTTDATS